MKPKEVSKANMPHSKRRLEKQRGTVPRKCNGCDKKLPPDMFTDEQWDKKVGPGSDQKRSCKDCEAKGGVPEAREVKESFCVPIRQNKTAVEDLAPLALPDKRAGTCWAVAKVKVAAEPEESRR